MMTKKTIYLTAAAALAIIGGQASAASIITYKTIALDQQSGATAKTLDRAELDMIRSTVDTTPGTTGTLEIRPEAFTGNLDDWTATLFTGMLNVTSSNLYGFHLILWKKFSGGYMKIDGNVIDFSSFNLAGGDYSNGASAYLSKGAHNFEAFFVKKGGRHGGSFDGRATNANPDPLSFSPASAVPEPASWALMMTGFALVGGAARYRRRSTGIAYA